MKLVASNRLQVTPVQGPQGVALMIGKVALKTPAGLALSVPTPQLADAIAAEWEAAQAQGKLNKHLLKLTPLACVAVDIAGERRAAMLEDVVPYIDTDLVCYRAGDIPPLLARQQQLLDPLILWAKERFGLELNTTVGVMPIDQPGDNQATLAAVLAGYGNGKLAAFAVAVKPLGSAVLALALVEGRISAEEAFRLAHLEEAYESEQWGADAEKEQRLAAKAEEVQSVAHFLALLAGERVD